MAHGRIERQRGRTFNREVKSYPPDVVRTPFSPNFLRGAKPTENGNVQPKPKEDHIMDLLRKIPTYHRDARSFEVSKTVVEVVKGLEQHQGIVRRTILAFSPSLPEVSIYLVAQPGYSLATMDLASSMRSDLGVESKYMVYVDSVSSEGITGTDEEFAQRNRRQYLGTVSNLPQPQQKPPAQ